MGEMFLIVLEEKRSQNQENHGPLLGWGWNLFYQWRRERERNGSRIQMDDVGSWGAMGCGCFRKQQLVIWNAGYYLKKHNCKKQVAKKRIETIKNISLCCYLKGEAPRFHQNWWSYFLSTYLNYICVKAGGGWGMDGAVTLLCCHALLHKFKMDKHIGAEFKTSKSATKPFLNYILKL